VSARAFLGFLTRPKGLLWGGALVLSGAIVSNALFLQSTRHPAPFTVAGGAPQAAAAKPDELVRALQDALRQAGYYGGPVDGIAGPQTSSAIVSFERITGRDVTGRASPELLQALRDQVAREAGSGAAGADAPAVTGDIALPAADPLVAKVQNALSRSAYGQIKADGVFGRQTSDAIKQFQADHNLPVTGEIDDALLVELAAAGALEGE
jgi:peptidoglycan hydrolase-like protein with peptidoglycan-binding domain